MFLCKTVYPYNRLSSCMAFSEVLDEFSSILNTGKLISKRSSMHSNHLLSLQLADFRLCFGYCVMDSRNVTRLMM